MPGIIKNVPLKFSSDAHRGSAAQPLKLGNKGPEVAKLQTLLKDAGLLKQAPDSKFGKDTLVAVQAFQKQAGLAKENAGGLVGPATLKALNEFVATRALAETKPKTQGTFAPRPQKARPILYTADAKRGTTQRPLELGNKGPDVAKLQGLLSELGLLKGKADSKFGTDTKAAVQAFQKQAGLVKHDSAGLAGPKTLVALQKAVEALRAQSTRGDLKDSKLDPSSPDFIGTTDVDDMPAEEKLDPKLDPTSPDFIGTTDVEAMPGEGD